MQKPHFPTIIFLTAATLDLIIQPTIFVLIIVAAAPAVIPIVGTVIAATLMSIAYFFGVFISFLFTVILIFWRFSKPKEIRAKNHRFIIHLMLMFFVGIIPGLRAFFPENVAVVLLTHSHEKKMWRESARQQYEGVPKAANDNQRMVLQKAA